MKRLFRWAPPVSWIAVQRTMAEIIDEVASVEPRWVQAHRDLDIDTIKEILDEDYLQIRADGSVIGKAEALESYRSGKRRWDFAESDAYQISVRGEVATLVGRWRVRGENDAESFDYPARFMAIYARRGDAWRLFADQSRLLAK